MGKQEDLHQGLWAECANKATKMENLAAKINKDPLFFHFYKQDPVFLDSMFLERLLLSVMGRNCTASWKTEENTACLLAIQMIMLAILSSCLISRLAGVGSWEMWSGLPAPLLHSKSPSIRLPQLRKMMRTMCMPGPKPKECMWSLTMMMTPTLWHQSQMWMKSRSLMQTFKMMTMKNKLMHTPGLLPTRLFVPCGNLQCFTTQHRPITFKMQTARMIPLLQSINRKGRSRWSWTQPRCKFEKTWPAGRRFWCGTQFWHEFKKTWPGGRCFDHRACICSNWLLAKLCLLYTQPSASACKWNQDYEFWRCLWAPHAQTRNISGSLQSWRSRTANQVECHHLEGVQGHEQSWDVVQGQVVSHPTRPMLHQVQLGIQDQEGWSILGQTHFMWI